MANQALNRIGGLTSINMVLYALVERLNQVDRKCFTREEDLEHELRLVLNSLLNFLIYNNEDPSVAREFTNS